MNYGADQQRPQISDLHFDKFTHTSNVLLDGRKDSKTEVCTCERSGVG